MSALEVQRVVGSISKRQILQLVRRFIRRHILRHLFRIAISLVLLPLDSTVLFVAIAVGYLSSFFARSSQINRRREILRDVQFCPKTILVSGVNTPHGLHVARCCYQEGHQVVGADITNTRIASGESISRALVAYYRIPKAHYISRLLYIIQREKVDIWIPCSEDVSLMDDVIAKQAIESTTGCRCIVLDTEVSLQWSQSESFVQYLIEKGLPVVESHQVQSRDSIHRILHRSPTKIYHIHRTPAVDKDRIIVLPKKSLSRTYSEVSEITISKDSPWIMQQHARLGKFIAELLIIRGQVSAITIRPTDRESDWGRSPLNDGLAVAIHNLMNRFALTGGPRITAHLSVLLMVDEELTMNSVHYVVHIAGCTQGAAAIAHLLRNTPSQLLVNGYLAILSDNITMSERSPEVLYRNAELSISKFPQRPTLYRIFRGYNLRKVLPPLYPVAQRLDHALDEACKVVFWRNWRFALTDPLPWWWHGHIYQPLRELSLMFHSQKQPKAS